MVRLKYLSRYAMSMDPGWIRTKSVTSIALLLVSSSALLAGLMVSTQVASGADGNGNQELLADPHRPILYYADPSGSTLEFFNTETNSSYTLEVGEAPTSLDLNSDGTLLYVALSGANKVAVVDTELMEVEEEISLDFPPLSLSLGRPDRLYISPSYPETSYDIRIVDTTTGKVKKTIDIISDKRCVLDVSPDGNTLIVASLSGSPTQVWKYSIVTDNPGLLAQDDHNLASNLQQMAVDWKDNRIYLATIGTIGLEVVSLVNLDRIGLLEHMDNYPRAVALARDSSAVCTIVESSSRCTLFMFNTTTEALISSTSLYPSASICALSNDLQWIFLGSELRRMSLCPTCAPDLPYSDSVLAYSPKYVSYVIEQGILHYTPMVMDITIDGTQYEAMYDDVGVYRYLTYLSSELAIGTHSVVVPIVTPYATGWCNWSFTIDPESQDALRPLISPCGPDPETDIKLGPVEISASLDLPDPAPLDYEVLINVDGNALTTERNYSATGYEYTATAIDLDTGPHEAMASVVWGLGNDTCSWPFTMRLWPAITPVYPIGGSLLLEALDRITARVFFGDPEVNVTETRLSVNGGEWHPGSLEDDTIVVDLEPPLGPGSHSITIEMDTDIGVIEKRWSFMISCIASMRTYSHPNGYNISVPTTWDVEIDEEIEGTTFDFVIAGPVYDNFATNVLVISDNSTHVEESRSFFQSQYEDALQALEDEGIYVTVVEGPLYFSLSNHTAMEFTITWDHVNIKQRILVLADEDHGRLIVVTCSATRLSFNSLEIAFDAIIDSISIPAHEESAETPIDEGDGEDDDENPLLSLNSAILLILTTIAVVVVAAITALIMISRRRRAAHQDSPLSESSPPDTGPDTQEPPQ
jgi:hypothetical protein